MLIAAGGTAGHVVPALAVADELSDRGAEVVFAGTADRIEARLVPAAGYPLHTFRVKGLTRRVSPAMIEAAGLAALAPATCLRMLRSLRPQVVFGGGYVGGPMFAAAAGLRIPAALFEVDAHMGLANRLSSPIVRRVFLAFPIHGLNPPHNVVTGRPVPRSVLDATREQGRSEFGLPADDRHVVVVMGGSLGANSLNMAAVEAWADNDPGFTVVNITGAHDFPRLAKRATPHYRVIEYTQSLGPLLAAADLVVSRAGGSVFEIAAAGRPAILVPSPNVTADHQTPNAEYLTDGGAAIAMRDAELTPHRLAREVSALLDSPSRLEGMGLAARRLARPDAAPVIASQLLEMAR
ncbi:MAG: UDP-N-acetylglucosamine--N-acetylmuramyl-(pentapeptide) pyrophosphoryl-undecaprenol N-acetylglucosamine transferase [Gaiellales bacterium]